MNGGNNQVSGSKYQVAGRGECDIFKANSGETIEQENNRKNKKIASMSEANNQVGLTHSGYLNFITKIIKPCIIS